MQEALIQLTTVPLPLHSRSCLPPYPAAAQQEKNRPSQAAKPAVLNASTGSPAPSTRPKRYRVMERGNSALAIAVTSMTDREIDPKGMADWSYKNGYVAEGNGSYHALIPDGARHFGLSVTGANAANGQQIIDALADGKLVIALMGPGHFTVSGHFIILRGITSEGNALVADPISVRKTGMEWDMRIILREASRKAVAGGPFWILE